MTLFHRPELLAPGGDLTALQTAVRNGADAVYFGLSKFSARSAAKNLTPEELPEAMHFLHEHSARGYLALNTLMRDEEIPQALELAQIAYQAGIDAIIVQDIGLLTQLHAKWPDLILHGSTQMSLGRESDLEQAQQWGLKRLVLPRELSGDELKSLTSLAMQRGIETEAFIHGALCICYSGQCLMSSLIGGRSGNRGACAQPCRLDYRLNGQEGALYSPRDQSLLPHLPAITRTPLTSLKIEGRMRGPGYVGQVVAVYREALEQLEGLAQQGLSSADIDARWPDLISPGLKTLRQAFNRGGDFTQSYWQGKNFSNLMVKGIPGSHGISLGPVVRNDPARGNLWIESQETLQAGDVVAIRRPHGQTEQAVASAPLGSVHKEGQQLLVKGFHPDVMREIRNGDLAYRMSDQAAEQQALKADLRKTKIQIHLTPDYLTSTVLAGIYTGTSVRIKYNPDPALTALRPQRIEEQLKKTGGTAYRVDQVQIQGDIYLTIGQLNQLRRESLEQLGQKLDQPQHLGLHVFNSDTRLHTVKAHSDPKPKPDAQKQAGLSARDSIAAYYYQLPEDPAEILCGADRYELPLLALDRQRFDTLRQIVLAQEPEAQIVVHWPTVATGEKSTVLTDLIADLKNWPIDGICTSWPQGDYTIKSADSTANLMNHQSVGQAFAQGATVVHPSLELNGTQLSELLENTKWPDHPAAIERPLYGRLRLMTTAYCPIGKNAAGCRQCVISTQPDAARMYPLTDRKQQNFFIVPHPRICQAELLNSDLLYVPEEYSQLRPILPPWITWQTRLLFCDETPSERTTLVRLARGFLNHPDQPETLEGLTRHVQKIAQRLDTRLTSGHFQRGVI